MFTAVNIFPDVGWSAVVNHGPPNLPQSLCVTVVYSNGVVVTPLQEFIILQGPLQYLMLEVILNIVRQL